MPGTYGDSLGKAPERGAPPGPPFVPCRIHIAEDKDLRVLADTDAEGLHDLIEANRARLATWSRGGSPTSSATPLLTGGSIRPGSATGSRQSIRVMAR